MSESEDARVAQREKYEEKLDEINDGLLKAYCAGFALAIDAYDIPTDYDTSVDSLRENEFVTESHYYFWDGRKKPLEYWLQDHFGVEQYEEVEA